MRRDTSPSEFHAQTHIELPSRQIIRHCILDIVDVGNPVIAAHIGDVEEIEDINTDHYTLEMSPEIIRPHAIGRSTHKLIAKSDVYSLIGRCTEVSVAPLNPRRRHRKSVGEYSAQAELQLRKFRKVICEVKSYGIALVAREGHFLAVERLLCLHQREREPGVASGHKLPEELEVKTHHVSLAVVDTRIIDLEIVIFV